MGAIKRYFARSWSRRRIRRAPHRYLAKGEDEVFLTHRHPAVLIPPAVPAVIALLIAFVVGSLLGPGGFGTLLWWLTVPFVLWLVWRVLEWRFDRIVLTTRRIIVVDGIIVRKVGMMPFVKVTDLGYKRSLWARLLGYGAVRLESAGQVQDLEHISYIPNPDDFYKVLSELVLGPGAIEAEQVSLLREIRDSLRSSTA
ncbi:MAG: PH domain-containing protein [Egibacteraceae bacterium]